jgi:hypothetical protein
MGYSLLGIAAAGQNYNEANYFSYFKPQDFPVNIGDGCTSDRAVDLNRFTVQTPVGSAVSYTGFDECSFVRSRFCTSTKTQLMSTLKTCELSKGKYVDLRDFDYGQFKKLITVFVFALLTQLVLLPLYFVQWKRTKVDPFYSNNLILVVGVASKILFFGLNLASVVVIISASNSFICLPKVDDESAPCTYTDWQPGTKILTTYSTLLLGVSICGLVAFVFEIVNVVMDVAVKREQITYQLLERMKLSKLDAVLKKFLCVKDPVHST